MKKVLLITLFIWASNCFAQKDSTDIYFMAVKYYIFHLDSLNSKESELFIQETNGITQYLPQKIGNRIITIITNNNQREIYKNNNNYLVHRIIYPAKLKDDFIEVTIIPYYGKYLGEKKGYNLSLSDWITVKFKYDCDLKRFKYFTTLTGGI